jgi:hypothetical protein
VKLSRLVQILNSVMGNAYPSHFVTPDGRKWEPVKVSQESQFTDTSDKIQTIVHLKELK